MTIKSEFLASCEEFIAVMGITATEFGVSACGQRNFMTRLRAGKSTSIDTADEVLKYIRDEKRKKRDRERKRARRAALKQAGGIYKRVSDV